MTKRRKQRQDKLIAMAGHINPAADVWKNFCRHTVSVIALAVLIAMLIAAIAAGFIFDYDTDVTGIFSDRLLQHPNAQHIFGTDAYGRDVFVRVLYGARYSLFIGIVVSAISALLGIVVGASCAYFGGIYDSIILRIMDAVVCIPSMLLMLALVAVLGKGMEGMIIAMTIVSVPGYARIIRSIVLGVVHQEYVEAATAAGTSNFEIIRRHILPNCFGPILVDVLMSISGCIMSASSLSFLGMGIQVPAPEWGAMLSEATKLMQLHPHLAIFPGLAILLTSLCFNLLGDGLADAMDPKNR